MPKTDDIIKQELTNIGNYKSLKMRGFIGSSNYDQELWVEGGLTFRYKGHSYGSNDFAWYKEERWVEPETGIECNCKPIIVVEGTDCLNTRSYGTAQIQRFHHVYGPFMNGNVIGIYYLKEGEYEVRTDLALSVYFANFVENYKQRKCAYLVTSQISDIENIVRLVGDYGMDDDRVWSYIDSILNKMKQHFIDHNPGAFDDFESYLNKRYIFKGPNNNWIKYIGAKERSFTDSSIRYGHIVLGEIFVAHYLLSGMNLINQNSTLNYYFPLISFDEMENMKKIMIHDKEFYILTHTPYWNVISADEIHFSDSTLKLRINSFRNSDLNKERKAWNVVRAEIEKTLKNNKYNL